MKACFVSPWWWVIKEHHQSAFDKPTLSPWLLTTSPLPDRPVHCSIYKYSVFQLRKRALCLFQQIEMAQKLLNSDLAELISKMKLAQQYVMTR